MGACTTTTKIVGITLVVLYGIVPAILYLVPHFHVYLIFMHFVKWPFMDYSNPQELGVQASSRNFYLPVENGKIGIWQILPKGVKANNAQEFEQALSKSKYPIFVYNHGNCWSRVAPHRVKLYNVLSDAGYHVIAFDYRDSSGFPTESGMIKDAVVLYDWTMKLAGGVNPVFIWGHSLGTAISMAVVSDLCAEGKCPHGAILEAPFNNLEGAIRHHFLSFMFRWMPWMHKFLIEPPVAYGLRLDTDVRIRSVQCPVLIMHATDDLVVPFHLGEKLKDDAIKAGVDVSFIKFDQWGHKYICNAPELPSLIKKFVEESITKRANLIATGKETVETD